jgi:hypothetical protein
MAHMIGKKLDFDIQEPEKVGFFKRTKKERRFICIKCI